ncbi:phosphoribosylamine--glycine ligase [Enterococcus saigonensis]|uniref:Phosphoribosylamine--glycine ligase n=1 Tax=Enterococcus saigonensis TaxID=1805431 RepID=A0A679I8R3_9ENTE|nr:phosphoribosylamine--glycine ligase [Enterococcus saigonensis]BCA85988.1 phosphoribosylamine--glycine ligase [Enterococcus saigonensis]
MRLFIIGGGGREHAIAKKLLADEKVETVFCAPGNPGMKQDGIMTVPIAEEDHENLIAFAKKENITWTFVGPEAPLQRGIVDDFQKAGLLIFGPNQKAAQIESSKDFAKQIMVNNHIPTADYKTFSDYKEAAAYVEAKGVPIVIKADGLAAGKGVVVAETMAEALGALEDMLEENRFGPSGAKVVVEEFLAGEEFSLLAFVKDEEVYPMVIAQDHKRAYDGDTGPNTGGMGAYSPVPQISDEVVQKAVKEILEPAASGMVKNGTPFTGILYAGLIATKNGVKVIEFNARFGDPETQVVLPRLKSSLADIVTNILAGKKPAVTWHDNAAFGVVVAAQGYPKEYQKDMLLPQTTTKNTVLYFAGATEKAGKLVANGGRIFLVAAEAENLKTARDEVYQALGEMDLPQMFYRKDIGAKALN